MKIIALTIVVLIALIASGGSLPSKQPGVVISHVSDHRNTDPFHGSEVGATLVRACGNCHSNQTVLPWYGHVAPVSWWIHRHLREGREELNFSEWTTYSAPRRRSELESMESFRMGECHRHRIGFSIPNHDYKLRIRK